ncbi:MAG: hypothetical protein GY789_15685 [Hyphomicrobiales bacterium]|nr:hypothetical protein [Hyphomicrobiales bacterium]MCP4999848.1 hypothetical protein [Hyphomicrobiales bacterium]
MIDLHEAAISLVRLATMPNGYMIPDGDTFGIESGEFSYRVTHLDSGETDSPDGKPSYKLSLLFYQKYNHTAPDYQRGELVSGGIAEAASLVEDEGEASEDTVAEWENRERMADGVGGQFQIYRTQEAGPDSPSPPGSGASGRRQVFGKRTTPFGRRH